MRCSECSKEVRPIVAVDIDGTLGDYHGHLHRFLEDYFNLVVPPTVRYDGSLSYRDWATSVFGVTVREFREAKLAYRQGGMKRSMPVYPGAAPLCHGVREAGAELWITTTRPYLRLDNIDPDTREWLHRNHIDFDGLLFDEAKYAALATRVDPERVVAVVDDLGEMVAAAREQFGPEVPIQRQTEYNESDRVGSYGAPHLGIIESMVRDRIKQWYDQGGSK